VNKKAVWDRGKGRGQVNMKSGLAVDSVRMEVKITGLWMRAITGCNTSYNVGTVCCLQFIA
jgi:hypothetical protein